MSTDLTKALQATTMLVDFHGGYWEAHRNDASLTEQVRSNANAKGDIGRFKKNVLAGADAEYKEACAVVRKARQTFYDFTLPWSTAGIARGPRLLPTRKFDEFIVAMGNLRNDLVKAVQAFLAAYDQSKQTAMANLGSAANAADYPSAESLASAFYINIDFEPVPDGAAFSGLPDGTIQKLQQNIVVGHQRRMENAINDALGQVQEAMTRVADTLGEEDKRFRDTLVTNVSDLVDKLEAFNIAGDQRMATIHAELKARFSGLSAKDIRKNTTVRKAAAADAKSILDKLASYGV